MEYMYNLHALAATPQIIAQPSASDLEKEEGTCGYAVFAALAQTAETEWSKFLLTCLIRALKMPGSKEFGSRHFSRFQIIISLFFVLANHCFAK